MSNLKIYDNIRIILKKGKLRLVPLILAVSMINGCTSENHKMENTTLSTPSVRENINNYPKKEEKSKQRFCYIDATFETEQIDDNFYRIEKEEANNDKYCTSIDELKKYVSLENATYSDIKKAIKKNPNISNKHEKWLLKGINNLESYPEKFDLSILYHNIQRMNIIKISSNKMLKKIGSYGACFEMEDGNANVYVTKDITNYQLCHEVFGHGISITEIEKDGTLYHYSPSMMAIYYHDGENEIKKVGYSLEEGKADLISDIATGSNEGPYRMEKEQFRIFRETTNTSLSDFISNGVTYLIDNMKKNDINKPLEYILRVDGLRNEINNDNIFDFNEEYSMENNMKAYFCDYVDDKINNGTSVKEVKKKTKKILNSTKYDYIFAGDTVIYDMISMPDLKKEIMNEINGIVKKKKLSSRP